MAVAPVVLIGFADALAAPESAWSLVDSGFDVYAFNRDGTRPALALSRYVRVMHVTAPEKDSAQSAEDIAGIVRQLNPDVVLPLDDHAVLLCNQVAQSLAQEQREPIDTARRVIFAGPTGRFAKLALDKRDQLRLAADVGMHVLPYCDAYTEPPPGVGPWMVKPGLAVWQGPAGLLRPNGSVATTPAQVREIAEALDCPVTVQPLICGTGEGVFGLAVSGGTVRMMSAHRRIRMMNPRGSGSSACESIPVPEDVCQPVRDFIAKADWRGLFMIEFLRDKDGRPWFMEMNGRPWGSMALARRRGYEYPSWAVRVALEPGLVLPSIDEAASDRHFAARHLGREVVHVGFVLVRGGGPRCRTVLNVLTLHRADRWYNWRRDEWRVFVADCWFTVKNQLFG